LTHSGRLTHKVVTRQPWIRRRSGKVRRLQTDILTTEPRRQPKTVFFGLCCTDCSKVRRLKWIWFGSTTQRLACTVTSLHRHGSGVLKNKTLHWTRKKGLKHSRSMWATVKGSFVERKGAISPGVSDRKRYKTRHTVKRLFSHIKQHKRLIARFDRPDATFFSRFDLACLSVFKVLC